MDTTKFSDDVLKSYIYKKYNIKIKKFLNGYIPYIKNRIINDKIYFNITDIFDSLENKTQVYEAKHAIMSAIISEYNKKK